MPKHKRGMNSQRFSPRMTESRVSRDAATSPNDSSRETGPHRHGDRHREQAGDPQDEQPLNRHGQHMKLGQVSRSALMATHRGSCVASRSVAIVRARSPRIAVRRSPGTYDRLAASARRPRRALPDEAQTPEVSRSEARLVVLRIVPGRDQRDDHRVKQVGHAPLCADRGRGAAPRCWRRTRRRAHRGYRPAESARESRQAPGLEAPPRDSSRARPRAFAARASRHRACGGVVSRR